MVMPDASRWGSKPAPVSAIYNRTSAACVRSCVQRSCTGVGPSTCPGCIAGAAPGHSARKLTAVMSAARALMPTRTATSPMRCRARPARMESAKKLQESTWRGQASAAAGSAASVDLRTRGKYQNVVTKGAAAIGGLLAHSRRL